MRELRFDGLSPDGSKLILVGKDGQRWSLVIDERIEAAVRRDRARLSQVELENSGVLRPREIQARIRAGATAEDVAAASGLPVEHVRRFEGPVLTERAWVAQQAQGTAVRRPAGDVELGDLVAERLGQEGVDPADISWDAWRRDDGRWVVIATFPIEPNTHVATWTYDSSSRTMTVADDNARALSDITDQQPLRLVARRPALASVASLPEPLPIAESDTDADDWPEDLDGGAAGADPVVASVSAIADARADDTAQADASPAPLAGAVGLVAAVPDQAGDAGDLPAAVDPAEAAVSAESPAPDGTAGEVGGADSDGAHDSDADEQAPPEAADQPTASDPRADADAAPAAEETSGGASADTDGADTDSADTEGADTEGADTEGAGEPAGPTLDAEDVPLFDTPMPTHPPASRSGRPAVPSFDDILFGPGPKKG